jgi:pyrrolysine biosynthesis protein PylD
MTRLKNSDICRISSCLTEYDQQLQAATGQSLLGIAARTYGVDEIKLSRQIQSFSIHIVPVTSGQGIITDFSETVCNILKFLGFDSHVTDEIDTSGLALAFEKKADAIMMADDKRFVGVNLSTRRVVDNIEATGKVFATALDLMAGGVQNSRVLIMGCGPVGEVAAKKLLGKGARLSLYDSQLETASALKEKLTSGLVGKSRVQIVDDFTSHASTCHYILEATPSEKTIPDELISENLLVSAPGVPLGISKSGCKMLNNRLVHDKLELGVAAMAVGLVLNQGG